MRLDMTMMLAVHAALRRESAQVARVATGRNGVAAEHAVLDPLIAAIDAGVDVADRADALATAIDTHLRHEETDVLPLIQAVLPAEEWQRFGQEHGTRVGADAPRYLPWVLEGMGAGRAGTILDRMPPRIQEQYRDQWRSAYAELVRWPA